MSPRHPAVVLVACAGWLTLTTGYGAAAAAAPVDLGGEPVSGSTDRAQPTALEAGLWADTLGDAEGGSNVHYFSYERQMRFSTVHVGFIGASADPDGDSVELDVLAPGKVECGTASGSAYVVDRTFGGRARAGPAEPGVLADDPCVTQADLEIVVEHTSGAEDLPIAIKIVEEAPVAGVDSLPEPDESPSFVPGDRPEGGDNLAGATSFDDATAVPLSGGTAAFSTEVTEGEEVLYRIPLTWGQGLTVEARAPKIDQEAYDESGGRSPTVELNLVDPLRATSSNAVEGLTPAGYPTPDEAAAMSVGMPRVEYLNRYAHQAAIVPGDYWLSIGVPAAPEGEESLSVPLDVTVTVDGGPSGAPSYERTVQSPDTDPGPASYDPDEPFLIGPDEFSAVASGNPVLPDGASDGWWGPRRFAGIALAVVSLLVCGLGARRLVR